MSGRIKMALGPTKSALRTKLAQNALTKCVEHVIHKVVVSGNRSISLMRADKGVVCARGAVT